MPNCKPRLNLNMRLVIISCLWIGSHGIGQKNPIQEMKEVVISYSLDTILNSNEWEGLDSEDIEGLQLSLIHI